MSVARSFDVHFRILSLKKMTDILFTNGYLLRVKKSQKPRPQSKIVVSLLQTAPSFLYKGTPASRAAGFVRHKSLNSEFFYIKETFIMTC